MLKRVVTVAVGFSWLALATIGLYRYGWSKWTTMNTARFPDTVFCDRAAYYPTFGGSCSVPSDVAYRLLLTTAALVALALVSVVSGHRRRSREPTHSIEAH